MKREKLIQKILKGMTPRQLTRARRLLTKYLGVYGWDSAMAEIEGALKDFDAGRYNSKRVEAWLDDEDLDLACLAVPFDIEDGKVIIRGKE